MSDAVLIKEAKLQVIQHVPRFERPAYKCKLTRDLPISYGGSSSYTQHLPFGYYEQSDTLAGEAILELQCTAELVSADISEGKGYTALPVMRNGGKRAFMDVRKKWLQDIATEVPCAADTVIYFQDLRGVWRKKSKSLVVTIVDDRRLAAQDSNL